jgi:hypothetical protein
MSSLFKVRYDGNNKGEEYFHIWIIHPDINEIPEKASFFLNLVLDVRRKMLGGLLFGDEEKIPVSEEEAIKLAKNTQFAKTLDELASLSFEKEIVLSEEEYNKDVDEKNFTWKGNPVLSCGYRPESNNPDKRVYLVLVESEFEKFQEVAWDHINDFRIENKMNFPWKECPENLSKDKKDKFFESYYAPDNVPQADVAIKLSTRGLFSFLPPGIQWRTAQFR